MRMMVSDRQGRIRRHTVAEWYQCQILNRLPTRSDGRSRRTARLELMVNIVLGNALFLTCDAADSNHDGHVTVDEILAAVNNALNGCG